MSNLEWLTIFAAVIELWAAFELGRLNKLGWFLAILCNLTWIAYVVLNHSTYGLLLSCGAAIFLDVKGFRTWTQRGLNEAHKHQRP